MSNISEAGYDFLPPLIRIFSEIQVNPRSIAAYKALITYYRERNLLNEAEAFEDLLSRIKDDNGTPTDEKQR